jgi:hypothetical protein
MKGHDRVASCRAAANAGGRCCLDRRGIREVLRRRASAAVGSTHRPFVAGVRADSPHVDRGAPHPRRHAEGGPDTRARAVHPAAASSSANVSTSSCCPTSSEPTGSESLGVPGEPRLRRATDRLRGGSDAPGGGGRTPPWSACLGWSVLPEGLSPYSDVPKLPKSPDVRAECLRNDPDCDPGH